MKENNFFKNSNKIKNKKEIGIRLIFQGTLTHCSSMIQPCSHF